MPEAIPQPYGRPTQSRTHKVTSIHTQMLEILAAVEESLLSMVLDAEDGPDHRQDTRVEEWQSVHTALKETFDQLSLTSTTIGSDHIQSWRHLDTIKSPSTDQLRTFLSELESEVIPTRPSVGQSTAAQDDCDKLASGLQGSTKHQNADLSKVQKLSKKIGSLQGKLSLEARGRHGISARTRNVRESITIMSFDGGGVRTYFGLLILEALMDRVRDLVRSSGKFEDAESLRPCDVVDYMFGTSSGGLIALMLSRLQMNEKQCLEAFQQYATLAFSNRRRLTLGGRLRPKYSTRSFKKAIRAVSVLYDPLKQDQKWQRSLFITPPGSCRCAVVALPFDKDSLITRPTLLRSYEVDSTAEANSKSISRPSSFVSNDSSTRNLYTLSQVARATSAAPFFFNAVKIDDRLFVDGGIGTNNPTATGREEVSKLHCDAKIGVISFGSGRRFEKHIGTRNPLLSRILGPMYSNLVRFAETATQTETTHETVRAISAAAQHPYHRLDTPLSHSVEPDQLSIRENGITKSVFRYIEDQASLYLRRQETMDALQESANTIAKNYMIRIGLSEPEKDVSAPFKDMRAKPRAIGVPARAAVFVGHDEDLDSVQSFFKDQESRSVHYCLLRGIAAVGKTFLAREYFHRFSDYFDFTFWFQANTIEHLHSSYTKLETTFDAHLDTARGDILMAILKQLDSAGTRILLVFDDVEDITIIPQFAASLATISVIVTSRRTEPIPGALLITVQPLQREEGAQLMARLTNSNLRDPDVQKALYGLCDSLGGLPLALEQAAGVMVRRQLTIYEIHEDILSWSTKNGESLPPVTSIGSLLKTCFSALSTLAEDLMNSLSILDSHQIPEYLFSKDRYFQTARDELVHNSLIVRIASSNQSPAPAVAMHRLIQSEVQSRMGATKLEEVYKSSVDRVHSCMPQFQYGEHQRLWSWRSTENLDDAFRWHSFAPHLLSILRVRARVRKLREETQYTGEDKVLIELVTSFLVCTITKDDFYMSSKEDSTPVYEVLRELEANDLLGYASQTNTKLMWNGLLSRLRILVVLNACKYVTALCSPSTPQMLPRDYLDASELAISEINHLLDDPETSTTTARIFEVDLAELYILSGNFKKALSILGPHKTDNLYRRVICICVSTLNDNPPSVRKVQAPDLLVEFENDFDMNLPERLTINYNLALLSAISEAVLDHSSIEADKPSTCPGTTSLMKIIAIRQRYPLSQWQNFLNDLIESLLLGRRALPMVFSLSCLDCQNETSFAVQSLIYEQPGLIRCQACLRSQNLVLSNDLNKMPTGKDPAATDIAGSLSVRRQLANDYARHVRVSDYATLKSIDNQNVSNPGPVSRTMLDRQLMEWTPYRIRTSSTYP